MQGATKQGRAGNRWCRLTVAAGIALSVVPRLANLGAPLLERYDFRQAQTALTVQAYVQQGFAVLHYETPLFGPPWQVPFEFPLFQLSAGVVARGLGLDVDLACHLAALGWFYASCGLLLALLARHTSFLLAAVSVLFYVFSPFSVVWSRAAVIDYASVSCALAGLLFVTSWSRRPSLPSAIGAIAAGSLAAMVKITTLPIVALPLLLLVADVVRRDRSPRVIATAIALILLPFLAGEGWIVWTDSIKGANPATVSLTTRALSTWVFGTISERLTPAIWLALGERVTLWLLPGAMAALPLAALTCLRRSGPERTILLCAISGTLVPVLVFFNLYAVHEYYLIAITPGLAVLGAMGLLEVSTWRLPAKGIALPLLVAILLWSGRAGLAYVEPTLAVTHDVPLAVLGRIVRANTAPDQWIMVQGDDWSARIPYVSRRRAFMIRPPYDDPRTIATRPEFGALVCRGRWPIGDGGDCPPDVLGLFPRRRWVGHASVWDVYRVWPASKGGPATLEGGQTRADCERLEGWAWDPASPASRLEIELLDEAGTAVRSPATMPSPGLLESGKGDGSHAYDLPTPASFRDGRLRRLTLRANGAVLGPPMPLRCPSVPRR